MLSLGYQGAPVQRGQNFLVSDGGGYILYIIFRPAVSQNSVECPTDSDEDRIIELEIEDPQEVWRDNRKSMIEDGTLNLEEAEDPNKVESAETKFGEMMLDKSSKSRRAAASASAWCLNPLCSHRSSGEFKDDNFCPRCNVWCCGYDECNALMIVHNEQCNR
jgi:hypothetical protein